MRQNTRTSASTVANTLALLGMGGTIAGTGSASGVGYQAGQIAAQDLLGGIAVPTGCVVRPQQVRQLDSKDIGDGDWLALAQACGQQLADPQVAAIVITHGTDTLEETAWFLQCVLPAGKPVVLTCAMRPASALSADGPANLRDALACAADGGALAWAQDNVQRLGVAAQVQLCNVDLFPPGHADLIVCNPPWLPVRATTSLEQAVYDPDSRMLRGFLAGLAAHLRPGGEGWLILSDLAEHLGLRSRADLLAWTEAAGLRVVGRLDIRPHHRKAQNASDPLHSARAAEVTSLWRLAV